MQQCFVCDQMFEFGDRPGVYKGKPVQGWGVMICNGCRDGNRDGLVPTPERMKKLAEKGIDAKYNEKDWIIIPPMFGGGRERQKQAPRLAGDARGRNKRLVRSINKPYLVAFRPTSMETKPKIIDWLRHRDAVHVLADVWLVSLPQTNAGDISHGIAQYDEFGAQLIVVELGPDWSFEGDVSDEARRWVKANLAE